MDNAAAETRDGWIQQRRPERPQPGQRTSIVQCDEPAVANHVGMHDRNELASVRSPALVIRHVLIPLRYQLHD